MLCQICKKNQATVTIVKMENGKKIELHACSDCANYLFGQTLSTFSFNQNNINEVLEGLLNAVNQYGKKGFDRKRAELTCSNCGMTYEEFIETGKLGCSQCYQVFKRNLQPLLARLHQKEHHTGKFPDAMKAHFNRLKKIKILKEKLQQAVLKEEYEAAAKLRDQINSEEKNGIKKMKKKNGQFYIRQLRDQTAKWVKGNGPSNHVVVSSRIRIARNIKNIPFPTKARKDQLQEILEMTEKICLQNRSFENFTLFRLSSFGKSDIRFLVEKRLISIAQANAMHPGRGFMCDTDEETSIMINEEDHLRIQSILPGLQLPEIWKTVNKYDDLFGQKLAYAFDEKIGYLTSCPTNVGTGLRVSVMLHLPGLIITNEINNIMETISDAGYAVRGFYGEGTDYLGNLFQISNQTTLGMNEEEIIAKLENVAKKVITKEQNIRNDLILHSRNSIEDQVMRAYGLLTHARMISLLEAMELLSKLRFGVELGIFSKIGYDTINRLMLIIQPAYLQLMKGKEGNQKTTDCQRAKIIQELID